MKALLVAHQREMSTTASSEEISGLTSAHVLTLVSGKSTILLTRALCKTNDVGNSKLAIVHPYTATQDRSSLRESRRA